MQGEGALQRGAFGHQRRGGALRWPPFGCNGERKGRKRIRPTAQSKHCLPRGLGRKCMHCASGRRADDPLALTPPAAVGGAVLFACLPAPRAEAQQKGGRGKPPHPPLFARVRPASAGKETAQCLSDSALRRVHRRLPAADSRDRTHAHARPPAPASRTPPPNLEKPEDARPTKQKRPELCLRHSSRKAPPPAAPPRRDPECLLTFADSPRRHSGSRRAKFTNQSIV